MTGAEPRYNPNTGNIDFYDQDGVVRSVAADVLKYSFGSLVSNGVFAADATAAAVAPVKKITSQSLPVTGFTDNTDTTGFIDITTQLPAGAIVVGWKAVVSAGFAGDTSAVIKIGKAGALAIFSADTAQSVFAAGTVGSAGVAATDFCAAATTARVTVTTAADFTSCKTNATGVMVVTIYYVDTAGF